MSTKIYQDNAGQLYLVKDNEAWQAGTWPSDIALARSAAADWDLGEWEPNDGDGWDLITTDWQANLDLEVEQDVPSGDRTRLYHDDAYGTYDADGRITVHVSDGPSGDLGYYDADGGTWEDEVRDILRRSGYEPIGEWATDEETHRSVIAVREL